MQEILNNLKFDDLFRYFRQIFVTFLKISSREKAPSSEDDFNYCDIFGSKFLDAMKMVLSK